MARVFISYKRADKENVFPLKDKRMAELKSKAKLSYVRMPNVMVSKQQNQAYNTRFSV